MHRRVVFLIAGAMLLAACAGQGGGSASPPATTGSPAPVSTAPVGARTVEVTMFDSLTYEPGELRVSAGETVRFVVHNAGEVVHEFYIGDGQAQHHHGEEMQDGGMAHDDAHGIGVEPGETATLEYTFAEPGELLVGCHEPGHYAGGMVATIFVEAP